MRAYELLEGYYEELNSDLTDLLVAAKSRGINDIPNDQLVSQLLQMGHNVNSNSIMTILNGNPYVQTATPDAVQLKSEDTAAVGGDADAEEDNEEKVSQMALDTAEDDLGL